MRNRLRRVALSAVATALASAPRLAEACSVCTLGRDDETRTAFILTTAFMSALPLALLGGLVYWAVRRLREADRDAARVAPPLADTPAPLRGTLSSR